MLGGSVAFSTTLIMWILSNTTFYTTVSKNYFVLALLLFATTMILGIGISMLFYMEKKEKLKKSNYKPKYNESKDFLGEGLLRDK